MDDATGGPLHDRIRGRKEGTSDVLAPCGDTLRVVTMPTVRDLSTLASGVGAPACARLAVAEVRFTRERQQPQSTRVTYTPGMASIPHTSAKQHRLAGDGVGDATIGLCVHPGAPPLLCAMVPRGGESGVARDMGASAYLDGAAAWGSGRGSRVCAWGGGLAAGEEG